MWNRFESSEDSVQSSLESTGKHTKYICTYKEYHIVCPLVGIGTLPPPFSPASVPPLRNQGGGGGTLAWVKVGGVPIPTTGEKA